ncbi:hypothetical protein [Pseudomonas putida]|uniref:hypothetical protein n=1 Tax=Pseudomonas putida TaxID=303 RepID=UPI0011105B25|nr:hypothetical protein [Pseudomonas putida]
MIESGWWAKGFGRLEKAGAALQPIATQGRTQGLRQALDVYGDLQGFQRRLDLDAQRCTQLHYPGLMGGFAVMMFLDTALG